ncbi:hypothetical protein F9K33_12485 [bacterium]|nr:MAG: hypothetical protein F9K33_12485 [bacterium]
MIQTAKKFFSFCLASLLLSSCFNAPAVSKNDYAVYSAIIDSLYLADNESVPAVPVFRSVGETRDSVPAALAAKLFTSRVRPTVFDADSIAKSSDFWAGFNRLFPKSYGYIHFFPVVYASDDSAGTIFVRGADKYSVHATEVRLVRKNGAWLIFDTRILWTH